MSGQLRVPRSCQNCDAESICPAYPIAGGCDAFVSSNGTKSRIVAMTTAQSESIDRQANPLHTHAAVAPAERARTCGECASFEVCRSMPVGRDEKADLLRSTPACTLFRTTVLQPSLQKSPTCTESQTGGKAAPVVSAAPAPAADLAVIGDGAPTMSTREIAELTGKRHDNVLADARKMFDALGLMAPEFSGTIKVPQPNGGHQLSNVFNLPKDLTITLVSGYSVQMRHRIVTRWMELETEKAAAAPAPAAFRIPRSFPEALRMAAEQAERAEAAEALAAERANVIVKQAPKVIACDILSESEGDRGIRDVAKELGVPERKLINAMIDKRWLYRSTDVRRSLKPMAEISKLGFARLVPVPDADGEKTRDHLKITNAGLTRLAALVVRWGLLQGTEPQRRIGDAGWAA